MKTYKNLYSEIISLKNLTSAWKKARKGKTKKQYVKDFEENLAYNLKILHDELKSEEYFPRPLKTFILSDPKTRKISKSDFRDRIVHHALCNVIEPIFDKAFIHDNCASRKGKGTLFAVRRFENFHRKVTHNYSKRAFCLKADIKYYFEEVDRDILLNIIREKIVCGETLGLIRLILDNFEGCKGMPLGNLTSQFFANVYLNELDWFIKHNLKAKFYIRYVDDFVLLGRSKIDLEKLKYRVMGFLKNSLNLELHPDKSSVIDLSNGIDFVGFKIFYYNKLLRKRNLIVMKKKFNLCFDEQISFQKLLSSFEGWQAYAMWADSYRLRLSLLIFLFFGTIKP